MPPPIWLILLMMAVPAIVGFLDCVQRPADHFAGGEPDRKAWTGWLVVAIVTVPIFVGYIVLVAYYFSVIRRNTPTGY